MSSSSNYTASRYTHHIMDVLPTELEEMFVGGVFVLLGKVCAKPYLEKQEAISLALGTSNVSVGFSCEKDAFEIKTIGEEKFLVKERRPAIKIAKFSYGISNLGQIIEDYQKEDKVDFGVKISYPLLFANEEMEGKTRDFFPEAEVFKQIGVFKRKHTKPVKCQHEGKEIITAFRKSVAKKEIDL